MKRYIFVISILFLLNHPFAFSQQHGYVIGKVVDSKTAEPVPFATVRLKNSQVGIITNAEGDFRILNEPEFQSDSLIVTCIGFHRLSVPFGMLKKSVINNLRLETYVYELHEVTVNARRTRQRNSLTSVIIVDRAIRKIKDNNPTEPFSYVSYYRDYQKDSTNYLNLNEAIIQTLDKGFDNPSDSNRYRLLDFRKNMDFPIRAVTPYYNLPETDHSDVWFKKIPHAIVGDQYGNEFFILLVHDPIRNFNKKSFSFVDVFEKDFIKNHWFSAPEVVHDGNTLLNKINFIAKPRITEDIFQGSIFIHPDDYSIQRLEYSGSYLDSEKEKKDIFNIEIEYGREPAVDSMMCLKYISFNNTFTIPDSTDNDFFKLIKAGWWLSKFEPLSGTMMVFAEFNRKIDTVSGMNKENYNIYVGNKHAKIKNIRVDGINVFITLRNDHFKRNEVIDSTVIVCKNLKDINGNLITKRRDLVFRQFRELFVQDYNKKLSFGDTCFIRSVSLKQNCISISDNSKRYWMNSPLKAEEKEQDPQNQ
ncbi:MAG TPA: carboxypeptidase-like regulatory domain-containing protein [Ignavibacteriaceae bacterium]|nr:carboxypeptidase-like regulatory domain-containing protein [Ignavibacteriaceae bacterium]